MLVTENSAAACAHATLEQVHTTATLIAVGRYLRAPKDFVLGHGSYKMRRAEAIAKTTASRSYIVI